ncbi:MAG: 50S ribosomal protein L19 [Patescibacteria group bacterium]|jgi:large subunit ribosomal protein L19|nr:50S ribosomal protein L19 [Patescibacteria group bacterium]MDD5172805.1 50S ribosomal protein L19 [Patescibacteria group bacterium]
MTDQQSSSSKTIENKEQEEQKNQKNENIKMPEIKPGMTVKVYQRIKETDAKGNPKERVQVFEGIVIACKHGHQAGATFTVRKIAVGNVGVEKIFPIDCPTIKKVEIVKEYKVKKAKLYFLRNYKKKLKEKKRQEK